MSRLQSELNLNSARKSRVPCSMAGHPPRCIHLQYFFDLLARVALISHSLCSTVRLRRRRFDCICAATVELRANDDLWPLHWIYRGPPSAAAATRSPVDGINLKFNFSQWTSVRSFGKPLVKRLVHGVSCTELFISIWSIQNWAEWKWSSKSELCTASCVFFELGHGHCRLCGEFEPLVSIQFAHQTGKICREVRNEAWRKA